MIFIRSQAGPHAVLTAGALESVGCMDCDFYPQSPFLYSITVPKGKIVVIYHIC